MALRKHMKTIQQNQENNTQSEKFNKEIEIIKKNTMNEMKKKCSREHPVSHLIKEKKESVRLKTGTLKLSNQRITKKKE